VKHLHLMLHTKLYKLHKLDMKGEFPILLKYSARNVEKYVVLKVSYSKEIPKFRTQSQFLVQQEQLYEN
jgi:hypothetical protein